MTVVFKLGVTLFISSLLMVGCDRAASGPPGAPPPPKVTAAKPVVRNVTQWDEFTGRLAAVEEVDVRAQVSGFVDSVNFAEGALVKKGDLLLTIDSRIFEAQLDSAKAELLQDRAKLEQAEAALQLAENDLKRGETVAKTGGIAVEELDSRQAMVAQARANVSAANASIASGEASIKSAELNVGWCRITAPISGRISRREITEGNMLSGGPGANTTRVTTIVSVDPIYCYVDVDELSVLKYQRLAREMKRVSAEQAQISCYMQLGNETNFPHTGVIDFVDNRIDSDHFHAAGRGVFANPDGSLLPGTFAKLRVAGQELKDAILVIDDSIGTDQDKRYLYVMHEDSTIERRLVTVGPLIGELRVITSGLKADEMVLVNGIASLVVVYPGLKVDATITTMPEHRLPLAAAAAPVSPSATATATAQATAPAASTMEGGK